MAEDPGAERHRQRRTLSAVALTAALAMLVTAGCEPKDRRPGTWLAGAVVETPVTDWSFVNEHPEVYVETRPWYLIPHSVTTVIASSGDKVFVPSIYDAPAPFPGSKYWNRIIADNPAVRVKIGERLYAMEARPAADPNEFQEGLAALARKYDFWRQVRDGGKPDLAFVIIRLQPTGG